MPNKVYIGRRNYWYHSSSTNYHTIQKRMAWYKKNHKSKSHLIKSDNWFTGQKMYHLYLTKVRNLA